jgi:hypothetical protein
MSPCAPGVFHLHWMLGCRRQRALRPYGSAAERAGHPSRTVPASAQISLPVALLVSRRTQSPRPPGTAPHGRQRGSSPPSAPPSLSMPGQIRMTAAVKSSALIPSVAAVASTCLSSSAAPASHLTGWPRRGGQRRAGAARRRLGAAVVCPACLRRRRRPPVRTQRHRLLARWRRCGRCSRLPSSDGARRGGHCRYTQTAALGATCPT